GPCGIATTAVIPSGQCAPSAQAAYAAPCGKAGCGLFGKHRHKGCGLCGGTGCDSCAQYDPCAGGGCGLGGKGLCGGGGCGLGGKGLCGLCGGIGCGACAAARGMIGHMLGADRIKWFVGPGGPVPLTPGYTPYVVATRSPRDFLAFPPFVDR